MNTSMITIKIDPVTKRKAQAVAKKMGLSLSALMKSYLHQVIKTKTAVLSAEEKPTPYMLKSLEESKRDIEEGRVVSFRSGKEVLKYLDSLIKHDKRSGN